MNRYAVLDDNDNCVGTQSCSEVLEVSNLIKIDDDLSPYGFKYDRETGCWIAAEQPTPGPSQPTNAEIYENQLIIMEALADLYAGGGGNG